MNRIKELRDEFGYTQQELAQKLESSKSSIGMYENGFRKPSLEILVKLSEIFHCSIDYLLYKTDVRNPEDLELNNIDLAFANGLRGLNNDNKKVAIEIIKGLKAKQDIEDNNFDK